MLDILTKLCTHSARLRDSLIDAEQQHFRETGMSIKWKELGAIAKTLPDFRYLHSDIADQVTVHLMDEYKGFFEKRKNAKTEEERKLIKPPQKRDGEYLWSIFMPGRKLHIDDDMIRFGLTKKFIEEYLPDKGIKEAKVPTSLPDHARNVIQYQIKPMVNGTYFDERITYISDEELEKRNKLKAEWMKEHPGKRYIRPSYKKNNAEEKPGRNILSLDLGGRNFVSGVFYCPDRKEPFYDAFVFEGGTFKNLIQWYCKEMARLFGIYDKDSLLYQSPAMIEETKRFNDAIKNECKHLARLLLDEAMMAGVDTIVYGWNIGIKNRMNLGHRVNQSFGKLPHVKLMETLTYMAEEENIQVLKQEEGHTSKCSALDREDVCHHETYKGKRDAGRFTSADGTVINSDINGAANILRKYMKKNDLSDVNDDFLSMLRKGHVRVLHKRWNLEEKKEDAPIAGESIMSDEELKEFVPMYSIRHQR